MQTLHAWAVNAVSGYPIMMLNEKSNSSLASRFSEENTSHTDYRVWSLTAPEFSKDKTIFEYMTRDTPSIFVLFLMLKKFSVFNVDKYYITIEHIDIMQG